MPQPITLSPATALAHERLYPRVTALTKQVERSAIRHPAGPVPSATIEIARTLFAQARKIVGREAMRGAGGASGDLTALSVGLSQLVAMLEAFEGEHSGFSARAKCVVWRFTTGVERPVSRLRPLSGKAAMASAPEAQKVHDYGHMGKDRSQALKTLLKRMNEREVEAYTSGYHDAMAGRDFKLPEPLE